MGIKVEFTNKAFPKDREFDVGGVALVKNGSSVELDDDQEAMFKSKNGATVKEFYKNSKNFKVTDGGKSGGDD